MIKLKWGNLKLGDDTVIYNMGTARDCPSKKLGLCEPINCGIKCYAEKAELTYPNAVPKARKEQERYWKQTETITFLEEMITKIKRRHKPTQYFRFNESGDFWRQEDVDKLSYIAIILKTLNITTYGYTARSDLDYSKVEFLVKGSGFTKPGMNGMTRVIKKDEDAPKGFVVCPGGHGACSKCNLCKINVPHNIAFKVH